MLKQAIFLDRDGVINKEKNYLYKIEEFEFIDGVFEACAYLTNLGFKIIIVTNQSGISRGYYSEKDFQIINQWMINQFNKRNIDILDVFYCPHSHDSGCNCRKPKPGMLLKAQKKHNIDMEKSWLIGDKEDDITAANNAGIFNTIIVESGHAIDKSKSNAKHFLNSIQYASKVIKTDFKRSIT
jgi:D-glycero-D-manno-heptose 1,7-bisphosphate phosphatase